MQFWAATWKRARIAYTRNKGLDQPGHSERLIRIYVVCQSVLIPLFAKLRYGIVHFRNTEVEGLIMKKSWSDKKSTESDPSLLLWTHEIRYVFPPYDSFVCLFCYWHMIHLLISTEAPAYYYYYKPLPIFSILIIFIVRKRVLLLNEDNEGQHQRAQPRSPIRTFSVRSYILQYPLIL